MSGSWFVGGTQLKPGQKLTPGAVIKAKEPNAKYARVVVMLLDYSEVSRTCDRKGLCGEPIRLPDAVNIKEAPRRREASRPRSFWERVVAALTVSRRRGYVEVLPRGGGKLPDGVVRLLGGRIDLGPVLKYVKGREFLLDLDAVRPDSGEVTERAASRLRLRRGRKGSAVVEIPPHVTPGLYKLTLSAAGSGGQPWLPAFAWVLVADAQSYRRQASLYQSARTVAATWEAGKDADDFLRAFLGASVGEMSR